MHITKCINAINANVHRDGLVRQGIRVCVCVCVCVFRSRNTTDQNYCP